MDKVINILIRTSERPNYFRDCINTVDNQNYKNKRVFISCDSLSTIDYVEKYKINGKVINVERKSTNGMNNKQIVQGIDSYPMPANLYFNEMYKYIDGGYVLFLDDDDKFTNDDSLKIISTCLNEDNIVFWKVKFPERIVPSNKNFGCRPVVCDISGIGFCFHSKYLKFAKWDDYSLGDFRIASLLYDVIPNKVYINGILTSIQRKHSNGMGKRDDKLI